MNSVELIKITLNSGSLKVPSKKDIQKAWDNTFKNSKEEITKGIYK